MLKCLVLAFSISLASCQYGHQQHSSYNGPSQPVYHQPLNREGSQAAYEQEGHEEYAEPHYSFEYSVSDPHTGDFHSQKEERKGDLTQGEYSLVEPDGSKRTVQYHVEGKSGFLAEVQREQGKGGYEQQKHYQPQQQSYKPQQAYSQPQQQNSHKTQHSYNQPQQQSYYMPHQAYNQPQQAYNNPEHQRFYKPQQSNSQPQQQSYSKPQHSDNESHQHSYIAYNQSQQTYNQPQEMSTYKPRQSYNHPMSDQEAQTHQYYYKPQSANKY